MTKKILIPIKHHIKKVSELEIEKYVLGHLLLDTIREVRILYTKLSPQQKKYARQRLETLIQKVDEYYNRKSS